MTPKIIEKPKLPKEITTAEAQPRLLAQAVRVYLANQRQGTQSALTRAQVSRTRKKLYKQKGTGGARHGDRKAPIFVGGGIAFAPKPRDHSLKFSKDMRRLAILGALNMKLKEKSVLVAENFDKLTGKTKEAAAFFREIGSAEKKARKILLITDKTRENVFRSARNLPAVTVLPAPLVNTYEILKADLIVIMAEAVDALTFASTSEKTPETLAPKSILPAKKISRTIAKPKKLPAKPAKKSPVKKPVVKKTRKT